MITGPKDFARHSIRMLLCHEGLLYNTYRATWQPIVGLYLLIGFFLSPPIRWITTDIGRDPHTRKKLELGNAETDVAR